MENIWESLNPSLLLPVHLFVLLTGSSNISVVNSGQLDVDSSLWFKVLTSLAVSESQCEWVSCNSYYLWHDYQACVGNFIWIELHTSVWEVLNIVGLMVQERGLVWWCVYQLLYINNKLGVRLSGVRTWVIREVVEKGLVISSLPFLHPILCRNVLNIIYYSESDLNLSCFGNFNFP